MSTGEVLARERIRRSVRNVSELRDLLVELLDTDPDFAEVLRGPPVSVGEAKKILFTTSTETCPVLLFEVVRVLLLLYLEQLH